MELLHESIPFLVGMFISPLIILLFHMERSSQVKFTIMLFASLVLGACISAIMGELTSDISGGMIAILIDTSLVYTGAQLTYWCFWHSLQRSRRLQIVWNIQERSDL